MGNKEPSEQSVPTGQMASVVDSTKLPESFVKAAFDEGMKAVNRAEPFRRVLMWEELSHSSRAGYRAIVEYVAASLT